MHDNKKSVSRKSIKSFSLARALDVGVTTFDVLSDTNEIQFLTEVDQKHAYNHNAYILPNFDYYCFICGNCITALENRLVRFQKRPARLILDLDFNSFCSFV